jgi:uncharacterized membrane protein
MDSGNRQNFSAVLTPHRSLTREGFIAIMALIAGVNFIAGTAFFLAGAWPVTGFAGLDVLLVWWAFRRNFADGRQAERIELTPHELVLQRKIGSAVPQEMRFLRRQLWVELEEDRERELIGGLYLRSGVQRTEIGRFLPPGERKSFAEALRQALMNS